MDLGTDYYEDHQHVTIRMGKGSSVKMVTGSTIHAKGQMDNGELELDNSHITITGNFNNALGKTITIKSEGSLSVGGDFINLEGGNLAVTDGGVLRVSKDFKNEGGHTVVNGGAIHLDEEFSGSPIIEMDKGNALCEKGNGGCCGDEAICESLPVTLIYFNPTPKEEEVLLQWKTDHEINSDYFNVYRSSDGESYTEIGHVMAHGSSSTPQHYLVHDHPDQSGTYFYLLERVDKNAKRKTFPIKKATFHPNHSVEKETYYHSPCVRGEDFYAHINHEDTDSTSAKIIDVSRRLAFDIEYESEVNRIRFLTSKLDLKSGIHLINIKVGTTIYRRKVKLN